MRYSFSLFGICSTDDCGEVIRILFVSSSMVMVCTLIVTPEKRIICTVSFIKLMASHTSD